MAKKAAAASPAHAGTHDPRVDAYISKAAPFAQPILRHIRDVVHAACPRATETIKWGFPHFEHQGLLCSMAAFKQHCALGFWKGSLVLERQDIDGDAIPYRTVPGDGRASRMGVPAASESGSTTTGGVWR